MEKQTERWKQVEDFPRYLVSTHGRVLSTVKGSTMLKLQTDGVGYKHARLYPEDARFGYYPNGRGIRPKLEKIHRLVLKTFNPTANPDLECDHINADKTDNRLENLEWVSRQVNIQRSWDLGLRKDTHTKIARKNRKPLVAIHRDGTKRYFKGNIVAKVGLGCSLGVISNSLKNGVEIKGGPAKGYIFKRITELPKGAQYEVVDNLQEKINKFNDKYFGKHRKNKR